MKILHITPEAPGNNSGGKLVVLQSILSLSKINAEIDYVGPYIDNEKIKKLYNKTYELKPTNNIIKVFLIILHKETNKSYYAWKKLNINFDLYDYVYLEFTKQDYIFQDIDRKASKTKKIVRVHNIEAELAKTVMTYEPTVKNKLIYKLTERQERYIVTKADKLITLTQSDKEKISKKYNVSTKKIHIIPVCIGRKEKKIQNEIRDKQCNILITGSLWYGPNVDGINWFLDNVLELITIPYKIIIAGYKPNAILKKKCEKKDIEIIDSPKDLSSIYTQSNLVVIPIFSGAGMKVKVADALAYGKPIVCTSFGLIGYEKVIMDENIYVADSKEDFAKCINEYWNLSDAEKNIMRSNAYKLFENNYSIENSKQLYANILDYKIDF